MECKGEGDVCRPRGQGSSHSDLVCALLKQATVSQETLCVMWTPHVQVLLGIISKNAPWNSTDTNEAANDFLIKIDSPPLKT